MTTQLYFDENGFIIVPRIDGSISDIPKLMKCRCDCYYRVEDIVECSICHKCYEKLYERLQNQLNLNKEVKNKNE